MNVLVFFPENFSDPAARRFAEAVADGDVRAALEAAPAAPGGVNTVGSNGATGLMMAVERRDHAMAQALMEAGADPNGAPGHAPLHKAVGTNDAGLLSLLLRAGADPDALLGSESALHNAARMGNVEMATLLLEAGATVDKPDEIGGTPILAAASTDHWQTVILLLERGASPWIDLNGITVADLASDSRIQPNNPDGKALPVLVERLKTIGYPWPPPSVAAVRALKREGKWPPPGRN